MSNDQKDHNGRMICSLATASKVVAWPADLSAPAKEAVKESFSSGNMENFHFKTCVIENACLVKCLFDGCTITNCIVLNCTLKECQVMDRNVGAEGELNNKKLSSKMRLSFLRGCYLEDTNAMGTRIFGSKIFAGLFSDCHIETSVFEATSIICTSILQSCKVASSKIINSSLGSSQTDEATEERACSYTTARLDLHRLVPEIRVMIFEFSGEPRKSCFMWCNDIAPPSIVCTGNLLKALRGDPILYWAAVGVFFEGYRLALNSKLVRKLSGRGPEITNRVKHMAIKFPTPINRFLKYLRNPTTGHTLALKTLSISVYSPSPNLASGLASLRELLESYTRGNYPNLEIVYLNFENVDDMDKTLVPEIHEILGGEMTGFARNKNWKFELRKPKSYVLAEGSAQAG